MDKAKQSEEFASFMDDLLKKRKIPISFDEMLTAADKVSAWEKAERPERHFLRVEVTKKPGTRQVVATVEECSHVDEQMIAALVRTVEVYLEKKLK